MKRSPSLRFTTSLFSLLLVSMLAPSFSGLAAAKAPRSAPPKAAAPKTVPTKPAESKPIAPYQQQYIDFMLRSCDKVEAQLPEIQRVAEIVAQRHLKGGQLGVIYNWQGLDEELWGRSGGIVHMGFDRPFKQNRTAEERANDMAFIGWQRAPAKEPAWQVEGWPKVSDLKKAGTFIIGFGPRDLPELAEKIAECDVWFDTGLGADDRIVTLPDKSKAGHGNLPINMLTAWSLIGELVSALTRHGKMPTLWKSYSYADGPEWGNKYLGKLQFHDDFQIAPIAQGKIARDFLGQIRGILKAYRETQMPEVEKTADLIAAELAAGRKTMVASAGHSVYSYISKYEDAAWGENHEVHDNLPEQVESYLKNTPEGALVLRLGYSGMFTAEQEIFKKKKQRVMLIAGENPRPEWKLPPDLLTHIDMKWPFGDSLVSIEGYPIKIIPPSGIMQVVAYEGVNVEVLARLKPAKAP